MAKKTNTDSQALNNSNEKNRISIAKEVTVEFEEKKSIFLGHAKPVSSEEEAKAFIAEKKSEYADATHNVYVYLLNGGAIARFSDDGEPQGTAGMPVLNVLKMSGVCDLVVVVTRYFGGILLGAGGLVRAYSAAARMAVEEAGIAEYTQFTVFSITVSYSDYQRLTVALPKYGASEESADFGGDVTVIGAIEKDKFDTIEKLASELTNGKSHAVFIRDEERPAVR